MQKNFMLIFILLVFVSCSIPKSKDIDLLEAVPQNTSLVIQVNDTMALGSSPLLLKIFDLDPELKKTIKDITPRKPSLPFVYCITPIGKDQNAVGFITKSTPADTLINYQTKIKYSSQIIGINNESGQTFYIGQFGNLKMISHLRCLKV